MRIRDQGKATDCHGFCHLALEIQLCPSHTWHDRAVSQLGDCAPGPTWGRHTSPLHPDLSTELDTPAESTVRNLKGKRKRKPKNQQSRGPKSKRSVLCPGSIAADRALQPAPVVSVLFSWPNFLQAVNSCMSSAEPSINLVKS